MASKPVKYTSATGRVSWRVKWRSEGQPQTATVPTHRDALDLKREVEYRRHMVKASDPEVRDLSIIGRPKSTATVHAEHPLWRTVADQWLGSLSGVEALTVENYERVLRDHLNRWDERPVDSLVRDDVTELVNTLGIIREGRHSNTFLVANAVLRYAVAKGYRAGNPAYGVKLQAKSLDAAAMFLTPEEVDLLGATSRERFGDQYALLVRVAHETGLRQSEVMGVQVRDLSLLHDPAILVKRGHRPRRGGGMRTKNTKNNRSRLVAISDDLAKALRAHVRGRVGAAFVFVQPDGVTPLTQGMVTYRWDATVLAAQRDGLTRKPRFHDLRHTHASDLLQAGVPMMLVSRRLGHSSIAITDKYYGHIGPQGDMIVRTVLNKPKD